MTFIEFVRKMPCLIGDSNCYGIVNPHHYKTRGSGGKDDMNLIPLCFKHHTEIHQIGKLTFQEKYDKDLKIACEYCWEMYNNLSVAQKLS